MKNSSRTGSPVTSVRPAERTAPSPRKLISARVTQRAILPIGKSRHRVRLHHHHRHPRKRRHHRRTGHVSAHAEHRRGFRFRNSPIHVQRAQRQLSQGRQPLYAPRFFSPPTRIISSRNPAAGTSRVSTPARCRQITTRAPLRQLPRHGERRNDVAAGASTGHHKTPYPACSETFSRMPSDASVLTQRTAPETDHRQRNPFGRHHPQHDAHVEERLHHQHGRDAQREVSAEFVRDQHGRAHAAPQDHHETRPARRRADQAQLLADHRINHVRVRFRQIEQLLRPASDRRPSARRSPPRSSPAPLIVGVARSQRLFILPANPALGIDPVDEFEVGIDILITRTSRYGLEATMKTTPNAATTTAITL